MNSDFKGVIFNLYGDGSDFGLSNCADDGDPLTTDDGPATNGVFRNNGEFCQCWLYAQGGTATKAGIEIRPDSEINPLPGASFNFFNEAFSGGPPTSFQIKGWRELYE